MIDINGLRRLAQAVSGWSNCNQAWLDQSEDVQAAVVGHIDEDGNTYPVATIDCDRYYAAHQSLPLAKFYAAANPAAISELIDRLEAAEKELAELRSSMKFRTSLIGRTEAERDALRAKIAAMEKQEPAGYGVRYVEPATGEEDWDSIWMHRVFAEDHIKDFTQACVDIGEPVGAITVVPLYALPGAQTQGEEE